MKINLFKFNFALLFVWLFLFAGQAKADAATTTIHLDIETATSTLYNDSISVSACPESPASATTTVNGFCALEQSGLSIMTNWQWAPSAFITSIGGASENATTSTYWLWFSDLNLSNDAINQHTLAAGEHILFTLGTFPLKISASNLFPFDGATTTISVSQFDPVVFDWVPAADATIDFGWGATTTDINGRADIAATSSAPFSVSASKTNFLSSNSINITPRVAHANITIRHGATAVFSGVVALPSSNAALVDISPTASSSAIAVPARSLLSVLKTVDDAQNEFAISDLQYYYFNPPSFYISCLTVASETNPLCGSWQYNLNGVDPSFGIDHALLKNGDTTFLYFGNQRQVSLSATAATAGMPFTATAQKYDPANNAYIPITDVTIGVTRPDPDDAYNPLEIATSTVNANGQAVFSLNTAGNYNVGIKEDYYFPLTTLTITAPVLSPGGSVILPAAADGSAGASAAVVSTPKFDLGKAIDFLISKQAADGSFGATLQTDWAALALASANPNGAAGQKVKSYLLSDPNPLVGLNQVSDYARRAMALMSLNINPYNGIKTNYIKKIIDLHDGRQFGDVSLYNDDIFALLVLNKAGFSADDEMIKKTVDFIIAKQQADGSWAGADLTAAAIQALAPLSAMANVASALQKGRNFLANAQGADGGFGNIYTTPWVMQAIAAMSENSGAWQKNNNTPESFLALSQGADGGLDKDNSYEANRVWATAYAIPAVQGKSWFNILNNFAKENITAIKNEPTDNLPAVNNLIATSTDSWQATSTLEIFDLATSSPKELSQASTTATFLANRVDEKAKKEKLAKPEVKPIVKSAAKLIKSLAPKALSEKIAPPRQLPAAVKDISKNQNSERQTIVQAENNKPNLLAPEVKGAAEEPIAKKKINQNAKKVLYAAGAGTVIIGLFLVLKLLAILL